MLHCYVDGKKMSSITIKKYPNRRLYDTEKSSYVTLSDVAEMVRNGRQVRVIDAKTNENVTAFILTQIIMEHVKKKNSMLPVSLLHLIIRFGDDLLSEFFEKYLEQSIQTYLNYKNKMDEQLKVYMEFGMDFSSMAEKTMTDMSSFQSIFNHSREDDDDGEGDGEE